MGAHTNIIITTTNRPRPSAWHRALVLALAVCSLVVPATASAAPPGPSVSGLSGAPPSSSDGSADSLEQRTAIELGQAVGEPGERSSPSDGAADSGSGYSSLTAITGAPASEPTLVSGGPGDPADGFDWGSAAVGAAAVLALGAFGGAVLLTVRRRTATAPPASTG
jgi:hypothetical protein